MGMIELERKDWENVRDEAKRLMKNAMMDVAIFKNTLLMAMIILKEMPEEKEKKKEKIAGTG